MSTADTTPIRAAILGFGLSGRIFHAPFLAADPDFEVTAVVTGNGERRRAALEEYPDVRLLDSPDDVWANAGDYDLVVIGTPSSTHEDLAHRALDAGLHVVVDKPFALTSGGGRSLVAKASQKGLVLTVFQNRRWDGDFLTVRRLVESGDLGQVHRFESRFERFKPQQPLSWKTTSTHGEGGGIVFDLGTHIIDQALQLFGPVEDVRAEIASRRPFAAADDDAFLALHHANGVMSHLWASAVAPVPAPRFSVSGSDAGYVTWGLDGQEAALKAGRRPGDPGFGTTPQEQWGMRYAGEVQHRYPTEDGHYGDFYRGLSSAIRDGAPPPVAPEDAIGALEIIERAFQ
ncbi:MAG: Gfo/Idh/MocA family protein [Mycobacteriaceae bacterium]